MPLDTSRPTRVFAFACGLPRQFNTCLGNSTNAKAAAALKESTGAYCVKTSMKCVMASYDLSSPAQPLTKLPVPTGDPPASVVGGMKLKSGTVQ